MLNRGRTAHTNVQIMARDLVPPDTLPRVLRRGYVTEALNAGQPKEVTADRVDMTHDILEKHYDKATKNEQMERREDHLKDV